MWTPSAVSYTHLDVYKRQVSGWGSLYSSANALSPGPWPFEFVGIPYVWHCLDGSGNGDYQMGGYTTQANFQTATTAPNLWVITPNSGCLLYTSPHRRDG